MPCTCNQTPCQCYTPPVSVPCYTCPETEVCKIKVPASCVTIDDTTLDVFLECNALLDYIHDCIVNNPAQYARFCALWDACP